MIDVPEHDGRLVGWMGCYGARPCDDYLQITHTHNCTGKPANPLMLFESPDLPPLVFLLENLYCTCMYSTDALLLF